MKNVLFLPLLILFSVTASFAAPIKISDRIQAQNFYQSSYPLIHGISDIKITRKFASRLDKLSKKRRVQAERIIKELNEFMPDNILKAFVFWTVIEPNAKNAKEVIRYHVVNNALIIRDIVDHPVYYSADDKAVAKKIYQEYLGTPFKSDEVFAQTDQVVSQLFKELRDDPSFWASKISRDPLITAKALSGLKIYHPFVLSHLGFIPGNRVELISENEVGTDRIQWVNDRVMFNGGALDWTATFMQMPGPGGAGGHIVFNDPMFKRIRDMIDGAKESIFIDIFLFGGTMGATLSRYLIDHALEVKKSNPNFKVLIMHDYGTNYGLGKEIIPVFKYIRDRIENEPEVANTVILLQANIQRHPPGIPFGLTNHIPKTAATQAYMEKMDTYYESKIDHSKVIVVDAHSDLPKAYFGSKNWTDHSGSYYYDDAIYVEGPAAAVVQAAYYEDVAAALTTDPKELAWFYYKQDRLDNRRYLGDRGSILNWFKVKRLIYPSVGSEAVRLAEANVDGKIKNVRNMLIDMIRSANKNIYMEQLFVYDKYINDALIKRKKQVPGLKIQILADHNGNFGMNGFPNTMFIKEMINHGIEIRARRTLGIPFTFPDGTHREFHQENHRKITSVDGRTLLGGSSNLNPDTLQGSFREFGAQIFDKDVIKGFEARFESDFRDESKTMSFDIENFQLPLKGKSLSKETSALINAAVSTIVRSKDRLEARED